MTHSWRSCDLVADMANPPQPPTIGGLLYPGKRSLIMGERDSLKTWLALILAKAEMDLGFAVGWADLDAMGKGDIVDRLRRLGVPDETISRLFLYYEPTDRLVGDALLDVTAELVEKGARLFISDAFNPFLSLHGLDPNSTPDVETFWKKVAEPICRAGVAVTMIDHVVKNPANRGGYSYGSERKASGAIVLLETRIVTPFGRGRVGASGLHCIRDRQGYLPNQKKLGLLELDATDQTITYSVKETTDPAGGGFRPTHLMEKVSRYIETLDEPVSKRHITDNVQGKASATRTAIDVLIEDGYATTSEGPRQAQLVALARPYREADDDYHEPSPATASPTASQPRPNLNLVSSLTASPDVPLKGTRDALGVTASHQRVPDESPALQDNRLSLLDEVALEHRNGDEDISDADREWLLRELA